MDGVRKLLRNFRLMPLNSVTIEDEPKNQSKATHDGPSAGSLFLRFGCIVFGMIGVIYYLFNAVLCLGREKCYTVSVILNLCAGIFMFTQMHFIFCNWKITILQSPIISRFGMMHLISTNFWTWMRYILIEEAVLSEEVSISKLMHTSVVEYSIICGAIIFVLWRNIGQTKQERSLKRKFQIRIDCSKTSTGLFLGLLHLTMTLTSLAISSLYTTRGLDERASNIFAVTNIVQRGSSCSTENQFSDMKWMISTKIFQESLDSILLSLGLIGQMIFFMAGIVGIAATNKWNSISLLLLFKHSTGLVQVGTQGSLIFIACKLRINDEPQSKREQPGKQTITFLLVANIGIFLMNFFEDGSAGFSKDVISFYGKTNWIYLVRSFEPLIIFYRFHSSVCLAEIWKSAYSIKTNISP
ncbi:unnamed protein product [Dracunculus medinensis]|uniref:Uncharacterized protein n=1 Tax=Dracunculus medinensis TaxID=318479 RepID=A0A3P7S7V3_DRAME|nr:unnamed protein product [Dracunculus medinensis]